jgi:MSHA biogenesis protein MshI
MSLFQRIRSRNARAGVAFAEGAFALCIVKREPGSKPLIDYCATHSMGLDRAAAIKAIVDKLAAQHLPLCAVVDGDDYQLVQVEAPDVLPSELRAAIRWRLKDAISFGVDEAAIDVFEVPEPARRTQTKMVFAVAARNSAVQRIASGLKTASRGFEAIDIPELCLRNIAACLPQDAKGLAIVGLHDGIAQLVITRQSTLYIARRIDTRGGFNSHAQSRGEEIDAGMLALQIQRSLDYYESHYDQSPISDLILAPMDDAARALAAALKEETSLRVALLDVREHFVVYKSGELVTDWLSLMALGAALRQDSAEA